MSGTKEAVTIVAGHGRCGLTLVTTMIVHGGMEAIDRYPYEDGSIQEQPWSPETIERARGRVVKVLDPLRWGPPEWVAPLNAVLMTRNRREQSKSHRRFLRAVTGFDVGKQVDSGFARSVQRDDARAYQVFSRRPDTRVIRLRFEQVLRAPDGCVQILCKFLHLPHPEAMAGCIIPRPPTAMPRPIEDRLWGRFGSPDSEPQPNEGGL